MIEIYILLYLTLVQANYWVLYALCFVLQFVPGSANQQLVFVPSSANQKLVFVPGLANQQLEQSQFRNFSTYKNLKQKKNNFATHEKDVGYRTHV